MAVVRAAASHGPTASLVRMLRSGTEADVCRAENGMRDEQAVGMIPAVLAGAVISRGPVFSCTPAAWRMDG